MKEDYCTKCDDKDTEIEQLETAHLVHDDQIAQLQEGIERQHKTIVGYTNLLKQAKEMIAFEEDRACPYPSPTCAGTEMRLEEAMLEIERLMGYVTHKSHCGIVGGYGYCTCGLDKKEEPDDKGGSGKAD